jgi:dienelactone hydrolase
MIATGRRQPAEEDNEHPMSTYRKAPVTPTEVKPFGRGPFSVGSTNVEVASEFASIGDEQMHEYLLGRASETGEARFISDILKHPQSEWVIDVPIPEQPEIYGAASGQTLPVLTFLTFPTKAKRQENSYAFPYFDARYGVFEDMLAHGEQADFADAKARYPLILIAHGAEAHGIYDVRYAHTLASHGYIVAVINYGDDRTAVEGEANSHVGFLRPLLTSRVLDSLLASATFGPHIDENNIGITGHSFGGFTALALSGGRIQGEAASVIDKRIKAAAVAAPWVGGHYDGNDVFAFGSRNADLREITVPTICQFGTNDESTLASFILPAMRQLSGPTYVVELVDQPHIFEDASWEDRNNWELLFFAAYLKSDLAALATLRTARSMTGGNDNFQLFDYQKLIDND